MDNKYLALAEQAYRNNPTIMKSVMSEAYSRVAELINVDGTPPVLPSEIATMNSRNIEIHVAHQVRIILRRMVISEINPNRVP